MDDRAQPASLDSSGLSPGSVRPWCRAAASIPQSRPKNAPLPFALFQNMPRRNVRKQRRVDESEHQLQEIHDVVEPRGEIGRPDAQQHPEDVARRPIQR